MYALVYNNKAFKIQDKYTISNSNNEVKFSDVTIDFTGKTIEDIPFKYQKMEIRRSENEADILNGEIIFVGYLDEIKLPDMKMKDEYRTLELTLLSPLKMATVRTVSIIGTLKTEEAIKRVLQPLLDDGFIIKEMDDFEGQISLNFIMETVENCMNNICSKKNIFWFINEKREIFIRSIDLMLSREPVLTIDENANLRELGLDEFEPEIENVDYANIINIKNIRLIYQTSFAEIHNDNGEVIAYDYGNHPILPAGKIINPGDTVEFLNPVIVDEKTLREYISEFYSNQGETLDEYNFYCLKINLDDTDPNYPIEDYPDWSIYISTFRNMGDLYNKFNISSAVTFSDDAEEGEIVLQRDQTLKNLITGFKYNGTKPYKISGIITDTGGFKYSSVTAETFEFTAELLRKGVNVSDIYKKVLETRTKGNFELLRRSINRLELIEDGKIAFTYITKKDEEEVNAEPGDHEGIVENGRSIEGVKVSIFIRQKDEENAYKVSMRSNGNINVSDICYRFGGGGHPNAAGALIQGTIEEVKEKLIKEVKKVV